MTDLDILGFLLLPFNEGRNLVVCRILVSQMRGKRAWSDLILIAFVVIALLVSRTIR